MAYGVVSIFYSSLVGLMQVGLFYKPGIVSGPTQRIYHLISSAMVLIIGGAFGREALGFGLQPGSPPDQQRAIAARPPAGGIRVQDGSAPSHPHA